MFRILHRFFTLPSVFKASKEESLLCEFFSGNKFGVFCDIGANTPESAVSLAFLKKGWARVAVDPLPTNVQLLSRAGFNVFCGAVTNAIRAKEKSTTFYLAGGESGRKSSLDSEKIDPHLEQVAIEVNLITLSDLLRRYQISHLDLLAIDVEGHEVEVLDTLDSELPINLILIEDWARDTAINDALKVKGYKRVRRTGYNSWYVKSEVPFPVSLWGWFHLLAKLNWFNAIRKKRFEKKKGVAVL